MYQFLKFQEIKNIIIGIKGAIFHRVSRRRIPHGDGTFRFIVILAIIIIANLSTAVIAMPYGSSVNLSYVEINTINKKQPPSIGLSLLPSHSNHLNKPQYILKYMLTATPLPTLTTPIPIVKDEKPKKSEVQTEAPPPSQTIPISHMSILLSKLKAPSLQVPAARFNKKKKLERKYKYPSPSKQEEKKLMKITSISPPNYYNNRDRRAKRRKSRCFFSTIFSSCKRPFCGWFGFSTSLTSSFSPIFSHSRPHSPVMSGDYYHEYNYDYDHHDYDYYDYDGHYETQVDPEDYYNSYDNGHPEFSHYDYDYDHDHGYGYDGFYNSNFDTYDGNTNLNTDIEFDDHYDYDFDFSSDFSDSGSSSSSMYDY